MITVIIPCRNEEKFIAQCLDSMINQDFKDVEILVVDGMSEDNTKNIIQKYSIKFPFIKLLSNPKKITPCAMNIGIKNAKGNIIMKIDAHAIYPKDFISKSVNYLKNYKIDGVGGMVELVPLTNTLFAKPIVFALSNKFGSASSFKTGIKKPILADTVAFGCFKKEVFEKVGFYDENMERSQDIEFNLRLKRAGGKILLAPDIICYYYPKSKLGDFFWHNIKDGIWATYPLKYTKTSLAFRHYIPLFFVSGLIGTLLLGVFLPISLSLFLFIISLYFLTSFYFSAKIAIKEKDIRFLYLMPVSFAVRHFGYGLGSIWGLIKIII